MTAVTDPNATLTFSYDSGGRETSAVTGGPGTGQPTVTLTYGYNAANDRTNLVDSLSSAGRITYQYDAAHRLTTLSQSFGGTAGPQVVFGYDPGNRQTSESRTIGGSGTAVNTTLAYDHANRVTTIQHYVAGGSSLATYVYGYDNADRVTTEVNAEGTVTYGYDASNELTSANGSRTESYSYDSGGNRNSSGYTTPPNSGNEMTAAPGETYTYDGEGNLASKTDTGTGNVWTYTWDYRDRLTGVTEKNSVGTVILQGTYTYDALNRRIGAVEGGTQSWYVYDGQNPYADFNSAGSVTERYLYGRALDQILARTNSGGTSAWYLTDRLGTVRDITNTSGTVIDHVVYDSYGEVTSESGGPQGDRFKFDGMQFDSSAGLYCDNERYYDPSGGRFISRDAASFLSGDVNLYRYVWGFPTGATDPTGLAGQDSGGTIQEALSIMRSSSLYAQIPEYQAMVDRLTQQYLAGTLEIYHAADLPDKVYASHRERLSDTTMTSAKIYISDIYKQDPFGTAIELMHEGWHYYDLGKNGHVSSVREEFDGWRASVYMYMELQSTHGYRNDRFDRFKWMWLNWTRAELILYTESRYPRLNWSPTPD